MPNTTCDHCNKEFFKDTSSFNRSERKGAKHYCSRACGGQARRKERRPCPTCGKDTSYTDVRKFCSKTCYSKWQSNNTSGERSARWTGGEVRDSGVACSNPECKKTTLQRNGKPQKFCSHACSTVVNAKKLSDKARARWPKCEVCGKTACAKNGKYCSNECWQSTRSISVDYRKIAFGAYDQECSCCGYSYTPALEIHHIDKDRSNNSVDNLTIVCANCHLLVHKLTEPAGIHWIKNTGVLPSYLDKIRTLSKRALNQSVSGGQS